MDVFNLSSVKVAWAAPFFFIDYLTFPSFLAELRGMTFLKKFLIPVPIFYFFFLFDGESFSIISAKLLSVLFYFLGSFISCCIFWFEISDEGCWL